jgi:hypothetical protein
VSGGIFRGSESAAFHRDCCYVSRAGDRKDGIVIRQKRA